MLGVRLGDQENVEHVFEGKWKRQRQRELQDAHDGAAGHQPQMRAHVAEEAHEGSARNDAVVEALENAAATLVGFVGSAGLRGGTIHRLRRTGDYSRTTIWHARSLAGAQSPENNL